MTRRLASILLRVKNPAMSRDEELETESCGVLHDRLGTTYRYTLCMSRQLHDWSVFDANRRIAYVWCHPLGEEYKLADWKIENEAVITRNFWARVCRLTPETKNYRRRGIGTQLLPMVITHAREIGARRITGVIASHDLAEFPELPAWYARFGFVYTPTPDGGRFIGRIELRL